MMNQYIKRFHDLGIFRAEDAFSYAKKKAEELRNATVISDSWLDEDSLNLSFLEKLKLGKERSKVSKQVDDLEEELDSLQSDLDHLTRFSPKLLLEYILLYTEQEGDISYELFEDVYFSKYESANQTIRQYMVNLTGDTRLFFKKYCSDSYYYYHLLLPKSLGSTDSNMLPNPVLGFCFPSGEKVKVLDHEFKLSKTFQDFPYLEPAMKELVSYRFSHPELKQKEVLVTLIQQKKHENTSKTYQF